MPGPNGTLRVGPIGTPREAGKSPWAKRVQHFALFSDISPEDRAIIVAAARERIFSRGQIVHIEGDDVRQVVLLTSGSAKMVQC